MKTSQFSSQMSNNTEDLITRLVILGYSGNREVAKSLVDHKVNQVTVFSLVSSVVSIFSLDSSVVSIFSLVSSVVFRNSVL